MADKKISQLTSASTPLAGTEVLPIVQSGSTVKVSSDDLTVKNVRANATTGILQVTGPAAASTRIMTVPDANFTAARTDTSQTFTGAQTFSDTVSATKLVPTGNVAAGNGLHLPAANSVALTTNGTNALYIDSSQNVGIGTASPGKNLEVAAATDTTIRIRNTTTSFSNAVYGTIDWATSDTSAPTGIVAKIDCFDELTSGDRGALRFFTNNSSAVGERARITAAGNFVVGTTISNSRLHAAGTSAGAALTVATIENLGTTTSTESRLLFVQGGNTTRGGYVGGLNESSSGSPTSLVFGTSAAFATPTERMRITSAGNAKIGGTANRGTTEGTNQLVLFNGTAPVGTLTNGVSFYSASGEANVMDAAGNATLLSPHDAETNEWIFRSKHTPTGKVLRIDVEKLLRFVNDHFGLDAVKEFVEE